MTLGPGAIVICSIIALVIAICGYEAEAIIFMVAVVAFRVREVAQPEKWDYYIYDHHPMYTSSYRGHLAELGEMGWELVSVHGPDPTFIFKKRVRCGK